MTQLTPQTAEQHRIAQEAGNAAYEQVFDTSGKGRWNLRSAVEAYQSAYQASLAAQQAAPLSADTQQMIGTTRRIWDSTEAEDY